MLGNLFESEIFAEVRVFGLGDLGGVLLFGDDVLVFVFRDDLLA